jgi:cell division transport system permease protein
MITLWRILLAGLRNFQRNSWLSTAATVVMTLTLAVILTSFMTTTALSGAIKTIVGRIDVEIYLKDSVTAEQTAALRASLESVNNVARVSYTSKSDALARFRGQFGSDTKIKEVVNDAENPLPASFEVKATDPSRLDPISAWVSSDAVKGSIDKYSYAGDRKTAIDKIVRISSFLKTTGIIASIIFVIMSILIIFNTIRMAIFTRREEIEIMKLVGATNWFIRGPFIVEAMLYGVIAAVLAVALGYTMLLVGGPKLTSYIDVTATVDFFRSRLVMVFFGELLIGLLIGATSSLLALSRYLKLS